MANEVSTVLNANSTDSMQHNRRNLGWVDPEFQKRYTILLVSIVILVSTVLIGTFWFHAQQVLNTLMSAGIVKEHSLFLTIDKQMHSLLWSVCIVTGLFSVFVLIISSFLSHRIVGPIFAIKRSLECIGRGEYESARITLRADDEFQDVATLVNTTVDKLEKK